MNNENDTRNANETSNETAPTRSWSAVLAATAVGLGACLAGSSGYAAKSPEKATDESWISLSGKVVSTTPTYFTLDYGDGEIGVEMDDFDFYGEGRALMTGDRVVVRGRVDHDAFEKKTIEAASVFVRGLQTHFYASPVDEEDFAAWTISHPIMVGEVEVTGEVTSTTGREFTVAADDAAVQVDTIRLGYDPMDDEGFQKIEVGDRVKVGGDIDTSLFDDTELSADWIVKLED